MLARVAGDVRVRASELSPEQFQALRSTLRVPNPRHQQAARRGDPRARFLAEYLEVARVEGDDVVVPRGAARQLLNVAGGAVQWDTAGLVEVPATLTYNGELRPYQVPAVDELVRVRGGVVVAPCGGGKTEIGLAALARFGQRSLIVVPSLDLLEQWATRARERGQRSIGKIGGGSLVVADLTIATHQTARKHVAELAPLFGAVLVDECHHAPAMTIAELLEQLPARVRIGLTATPNREDSLTPVVGWTLGPTVHTITQRELEDVGAVAVPRFELLPSQFTYEYSGPDDWPRLLDALEVDAPRLELVVKYSAGLATNRSVLVLTGRVAHAKAIAHALLDRGLRAIAITGDMGKKDRSAALDRARSGELDVLVATQLADEGLDIPRLGAVVLSWPQRAEGRLVQRIGRVLRPYKGKDRPVVVDVVDMLVGVLKGQAKKRARTCRAVWGGR